MSGTYLVISDLFLQCQIKGLLEQQKRESLCRQQAKKDYCHLLTAFPAFDLAFLLMALLVLGIFHIVPFPHSQTTVVLTCFDLSVCAHIWPFMFLLWTQLDKSCLTLAWLGEKHLWVYLWGLSTVLTSESCIFMQSCGLCHCLAVLVA